MNVLKTMEDLWSTEDYEIVGSQDEILRNLDVEILSVKFSKVGQKTFDAYPNLKWIVCRSHGYDNVNVDLAKKYNIDLNNIETYFILLKRTAKKNRVELLRVTNGQKRLDNSKKLLTNALSNIKKGFNIKNRLSCKYCEFKNTEHCT